MTNDKELQLNKLEMECKTKIAPSKIQGVGVFALRDLKCGEKLYADNTPFVYSLTFSDLKKVRPEIREIILGQWPRIANGSKFAYPTTRIQAYINHSDKPNYDAIHDVMLKDCKAAKEITEDYRLIPGYTQVFPWLTESK